MSQAASLQEECLRKGTCRTVKGGKRLIVGNERTDRVREEEGPKLESPGFGTFTGVHNRGFEEEGVCVHMYKCKLVCMCV